MSDRFEGLGEPRAFACVIRGGRSAPEVLVFDHPAAGTQIPKGRIDPGEALMEAAIRELAEESGLQLEPMRFLGHIDRDFDHPTTGETVHEDWYGWLFEAPLDAPDSWTHIPDEERLAFAYRWIALDDRAADRVHLHFSDVIELVRAVVIT